MLRYNPYNWYWKDAAGRLFSSAARAVLHDDDAAYVEWLAGGGLPTPWPRDDQGEQTPRALDSVLAPYSISTGLSPALSELQANAILLASRSCAEVMTRLTMAGSPTGVAQFRLCAAVSILAVSANNASSSADIAAAMTMFKEAVDAAIAEANAARPNT